MLSTCLALLLLFSHSVMSDSLWPLGLQHARLPCPSLSPRACSNSCPLSQWCHPIILSSGLSLSEKILSWLQDNRPKVSILAAWTNLGLRSLTSAVNSPNEFHIGEIHIGEIQNIIINVLLSSSFFNAVSFHDCSVFSPLYCHIIFHS